MALGHYCKEALSDKLPPHVYSILSAQHDLFTLPKYFDAFREANNLQSVEVLQIYAFLAVLGERFGDWPLYARASHEFYGESYYSDFCLQMEDAGMDEVTMYAQLRLLFQASFLDIESNIMVPKHLAFLHKYKVLPTSRLSELVKCKQLTWDSNKDSSYLVANVASILWVIHIVPNFLQDGHFFFNKYKF
jgi:hypothetical protein